MRSRVAVLLMLTCLFGLLALDAAGASRNAPPEPTNPVAKMVVSGSDVWFEPTVQYGGLALSYSSPDGVVRERTFAPGEDPHISVTPGMPDGVYTYELRVIPLGRLVTRTEPDAAASEPQEPALVQNGSFYVDGGQVLSDKAGLGQEVALDIVHADDVIIQGSLAVGFDAVNNENFGFDTIRLKENNLRIKFEDTSTSSGFPSNDWQLTANDSASGGANYFSIDDITGAKTPFKVTAGAPSNSFFMNSSGRIGLRTATPVLDLHIRTGNTPSFRLDQDSSSGFTAQTWDIAGNEANFFVRDVTGGSKLPFRIRPGAPTSSIDIAANGDIGMGTSSPGYPLDIQRTGANAVIVVTRVGGASNYINATDSYANFGSVNSYPTRLMVNGTWKMMLNTDNSLSMVNGASCTVGGVWTNSSSREYKDNIASLSAEEAVGALEDLDPVKFTYKADQTERHVGFVAEDVPELVATKDRKGLSPMDIVAVLTKVVQEQQKTVQEQQRRISELNEKVSELEAKLK
jgi:hypothetical protein